MISKKQFIAFMALAAIVVCYLFVDQVAARWAHENVTPQYLEFFKAITEFGDSTYYLIGFALAFFLFQFLFKRAAWATISLFLFASVAVSGILADVVKVVLGRYRPSELFAHGYYGFDFWHIDRALTSFPSGHTATAFALATAFTYLWPKSGVVVWPAAVLIGISRLMIGAHYPSDIIAGAFLGVLSTLLTIGYFTTRQKLRHAPASEIESL